MMMPQGSKHVAVSNVLMYCKYVNKKNVHLLGNCYQWMLQLFNVRTPVTRCTFPHTICYNKKNPSYGIPAFLKKTKTRNKKVNRMGKPYSTWQGRGYQHLPDTTLPVSQGRPCVRWWPSKRCWGHLESHSGRTGLKPLVMQPVQRRSEIKILKYLELPQHISHSPPTGPFAIQQTDYIIRDIRLQPKCRWDLRSFAILRSPVW